MDSPPALGNQKVLAMFYGTGAQAQLRNTYNNDNNKGLFVLSAPYLGAVMHAANRMIDELREIINTATVAWRSMLRLWGKTDISEKTRKQIFQASVQSVLLSGQEVSCFTKSQQHQLDVWRVKLLMCSKASREFLSTDAHKDTPFQMRVFVDILIFPQYAVSLGFGVCNG
ncbi:unnamed protein product [Polarella glacialis]|uniref:Uncharacterized protein n=1 Tax=Polarella glacialis TaxID=89957 RepID=A0A813GXJ0_POLGL|nr:unnamed protein product [Polarella glacialis]CAE8665913.1 unnamed protein product [Polarella glacialis]